MSWQRLLLLAGLVKWAQVDEVKSGSRLFSVESHVTLGVLKYFIVTDLIRRLVVSEIGQLELVELLLDISIGQTVSDKLTHVLVEVHDHDVV